MFGITGNVAQDFFFVFLDNGISEDNEAVEIEFKTQVDDGVEF